MAIDTHQPSNEKTNSKASPQQGFSLGNALTSPGGHLGTHSLQRAKADPSRLLPRDVPILQSMVGNQVVQRMIYGQKPAAPKPPGAPSPRISPSITPATGGVQIQRKLNFQSESLLRNRNTKKSVSQVFGRENTWDKLIRVLDDYMATHRAKEEVNLLTVLRGLATHWLGKYGGAKQGTATDAQVVVIRRLLSAINAELPHAEEEAEYMESLEPGMDTGKNPNFQHLTSSGAMEAPDQAKKLAGGTTGKDRTIGFGKETLETVQQYKLTDAEIAAIKIYTSDDYKYINPAVAMRGHLAFKNQDNKPIKGLNSWLDSNLDNLSGGDQKTTLDERHQAKGEGRQHGRMVTRGLNKLPDFKGLVYRGMTVDTADLATRYKVGQILDYSNFTSSSKNISVSEKFINGELQKAVSNKEAKSGVLLVIQMKRGGKDISDLSVVRSEAEVLWMPGQKLRVTRIIPESQTGKNYTIVEAEQMLAKGSTT